MQNSVKKAALDGRLVVLVLNSVKTIGVLVTFDPSDFSFSNSQIIRLFFSNFLHVLYFTHEWVNSVRLLVEKAPAGLLIRSSLVT